MKAHFVTFYSPGTFLAEQTTKPVDSWDVSAAVEMARGIKERHGATPYGFHFTTRIREDDELDSHEVERSTFYWLGGEILTLAKIKERGDPKDSILIENMESNEWDKVVENRNSYRWIQPLEDNAVVLDYP